MKILFVYTDITRQHGVYAKVKSHLEHLSKHSEIHVETLFYGDQISLQVKDDFSVKTTVVRTNPYTASPILRQKLLWSWLYEKEMSTRFSQIVEPIRKVKADLVVMRDFPMTKSGVSFIRSIQDVSKVLLESNTDIPSELKMKALNNEWAALEFKKEWKYRPRVVKNICGVIAVTHELAQLASKNGVPSERIHVFSNGIETGKVGVKDFPDTSILKGVFIAGTKSAWNGIDRLQKSLEGYRGKVTLNIDVIGIEGEAQHLNNGCSIEYHKALSSDELAQRLGEYHFGLSTLALFRKNMREASALKVRSYLAAGLPIVLAYDDTDIQSDYPFIHRVSNTEEAISFEDVMVQFMPLFIPQTKLDIQKFVSIHLDIVRKQKKLILFFEQILKQNA
ncbi:MAG: hypothetical protein Salg2KO_19990 [Salibacteraceae bacterium]